MAVTGPSAAAERPPVVVGEVPVTAANLDVRPINNSPALVADPTEPRFVAMPNRIDGPEFSCALQISGDGGRGWIPANPVPELPDGAERCYAPEVDFDRDGTLYYLFVGLHGRGNAPMGVFLTTSTDRARTFSRPYEVLGPGNYQVRMTIDRSVGSRGRLHLVWLQVGERTPVGGLPDTANPIMATYSDDGGRSFSTPVQVSDPDRPRSLAPALVLGGKGKVHVAYFDLGDDRIDYQGLEGDAWPGSWSVVVTTSTDNGRHFGPGVVVDDALTPSSRVLLIFTMPPPSLVADDSGRLFAAWWDSRRGDPDVFVARSADGGATWGQPLRLNDDRVGNGADQYMPRLSLAPNGRVDAVFLDRRNDPKNVLTDVYYSFSEDGGQHFRPNLKLTSEPSDSTFGISYPIRSAAGLWEWGSRLGLLSRRDSVLAAWPDMRNWRTQDVFAAEVVFPTGHRSRLAGWSLPAVSVIALAALTVALAVLIRRRRPEGRRGTGRLISQ